MIKELIRKRNLKLFEKELTKLTRKRLKNLSDYQRLSLIKVIIVEKEGSYGKVR